jgi:hypothetical protein
MAPPERPKPPAEAVSPRRIAESVGRRLREEIHPPEKPFGVEIVEETRDVLRSHLDGPCELGPYVESEDQAGRTDASGRLGGEPRPIAFDASFWLWFSRLTPERRDVVLWVAKEFRDRDRQTALLEIVDERIERRVLLGFLRKMKHAAIASVVVGFAAAHWFSEQISWIVEKIPVFKAFWNLVTGARN